MKEGKKMKRFLCSLLILCIVPVLACANDYTDFNIYASMFGAEEMDFSKPQTVNGKDVFPAGEGFVGLESTNGTTTSVSVSGKGDAFLIYSMAAISIIENNNTNFVANCGQLLSSYLMAQKGTERTSMTKDGHFFTIQPYNDMFLFVIVR